MQIEITVKELETAVQNFWEGATGRTCDRVRLNGAGRRPVAGKLKIMVNFEIVNPKETQEYIECPFCKHPNKILKKSKICSWCKVMISPVDDNIA